MAFKNYLQSFKISIAIGAFLSLLSTFYFSNVLAQERDKYVLSQEGQLEMVVHIIGEVKRPGEFRVADSTTLMELVSKAEGPTEFSNLGGVTITRAEHEVAANGNDVSTKLKSTIRVIKYNLNDYLKKGTGTPPPLLKPGDVVLVPRNNYHRWRNAFNILRDLSVIATTAWVVTRIAKENSN